MGNFIELPKPKLKGEMSVEEAIAKRRSKRKFTSYELSMEEISQLLWAGQGITDSAKKLRAIPSAGALYPLEIYIVKKDGFYHYIPQGHKLELLKSEDLRGGLTGATWGQNFISEAPISIVICAVRSRVTSKYGLRGGRYVDVEVGHAAENIHLEAVSLGLSSVPVGAYSDESVSRLLELPPDHEPIYIIPVGREKK
ncbi:MAG: nitroreductase [Candidatus Omnitrophica bacterium CG07_land_8_20_14_0_80_42_15]|uniref:Nitroreductase n=1 Tax=Candidatus Aquitaenariimonas noxiae TaxID=1974741 RepID=A0A2J0KY19_9BACT|nr:MAG: nitroreductase [Candidatus Omnitrophica bacterium CG07_land_8_20_14_0_80_42_15]